MKPIYLGTIVCCILICFGIQSSLCDETGYTPGPTGADKYYKDKVYCDFSKKNCSWMATGLWKWNNGRIDNIQLNGPPVRSRFSGYTALVADFTPDSKGPKTSQMETLLSPELDAPKNNACFYFNYYTLLSEAANDGIQLHLVTNNDANSTVIWARGNTGADIWFDAEVNIVVDSPFKLKFVAYGRTGYVAVEDFRLQNRLCRRQMCDFESGMCQDWTVDAEPANNVFKVTKASFTNFKNSIDHTSHSGFGHFAYSSLPIPDTPKAASRMISPTMSSLSSQCFYFSFMRSSTDVTLKLLKKYMSNSSYEQVWQSNYTHNVDEWINVQQQLDIESAVQLVLEADYASSGSIATRIAIDDIGMNDYYCPSLFNCPFVRDLCGWEHNRTLGLEWSIGPGRVENAEKLKTEVEVAGSALLYADFTTLGDGETEEMEIVSQPIHSAQLPNTGNCMTMDFKVIDMDPADDLTIQQIDFNGARKVLWSFKDSKRKPGGDWYRYEKIFIPNVSTYGSSRLAIRATATKPSTRILIDRVSLNNGISTCSSLPGVSTPATVPSTLPPPTTKNPYSSLACTFEDDQKCVWQSSQAPNNFNVSSYNKITGIPTRYLPRKDHTTGSARGNYAFAFNLKSSGNLDNATLTAPWPSTSATLTSYICVDFAYYYYTSGGGSGARLTVDNATSSKTIWRAPPGVSNQWHRVRFSYSREANTYEGITFRTTLVQGVLALDDINITTGYCSYSPNIRQDRICDFENEKPCLFEPVFHSGIKNWQIYNGSSVGITDHSTHSLDGHFYGLSLSDISSDVKHVSGRIEIKSEVFSTGPKAEQCIRFSYMIANLEKNTTTLGYEIEEATEQWNDYGGSDVHVHDDYYDSVDQDEIFKRWEITGNTNKLWFTHRVPVTWSKDYRIRFFIKAPDLDDSTRKAMFFIDDFTLSFDSCNKAGCDFSNGDICSLEVIPVGDKHIEKNLVPNIASAPNGSVLIDSYLNNNVEQIWQIFSPQQNDYAKPLYPDETSDGYRFGNYLLMTSDDTWQRAIVVTERYFVNQSIGRSSQICLTFHINKPSASDYFQIYKGDSFNGKNELIFSMSRASKSQFAYKKNWEKIQVLVENPKGSALDVFFYFVGTLASANSLMAIDNFAVLDTCAGIPDNQLPTQIPVTDSSGNTVPQPTLFPSTTFTCKNGTAIPMSKVCDYHKDCSTNEDETNCGSCDFTDDDFCGYLTVQGNKDFKWDFSDKFPKTPGVYEFGSFLECRNNHRIDFDEDDEQNLVAEIQSPEIHQSYSYCHISFSYRINGTSTSSSPFIFYLLNMDNSIKTTLYENSYTPLNPMSWNLISIRLGRITNSFKLAIRGELGDNEFESHSFKYVSKTNCGPPDPRDNSDDCNDDGGFICGNGVCIDSYQRCDFTDDCGDGSDELGCDTSKMLDFSSGYGSWVANPAGSSLKNGYQIKYNTEFYSFRNGPMYDHTHGATGLRGAFLFFRQYVKPTDNKKPITAEFESPYITFSRNCKMSFYYFKNSKNGTIEVILEEMDRPDNRQSITRINEVTYSWTKATPNFNKGVSGKVYKIIISSSLEVVPYITKAPYPYIAIDDISLTKECSILPDSMVPTLPTLPGGSTQTYAPDNCATIRCKDPNGKTICLTVDQMCDFVKDCADGSDETLCGNCNFNDGTLCGYSTSSFGDHWKVRMPASTATGEAPKNDANNSPLGGYATIYSLRSDNASPRITRPSAKMASPPLNARTSEDCFVRFSYFTNNPAQLNVSRKSSFRTTPFLSITEPTTSLWKTYSAPIGAQYKGFQLEFSGTSKFRYDFYLDLYVDNIEFVNCNPNEAPIGPGGSTIAPNSTANVDLISCDFENDLCGWIPVVNEDDHDSESNWIRLSSYSVEPGNDHTSLLEPRPFRYGYWLTVGNILTYRKDYLRTLLPLKDKQAYCFTFWYYFISFNMYSKISLFTTNTTSLKSTLQDTPNQIKVWEMKTARERNWLKARIEIAPQSDRRYLLFVSESYPNTAIGLDDFKLIEGECGDEDIGENCDFETGTCGWKVHDKDWTRETGNILDHTSHTLQGTVLKETASPGSETTLDLSVAKMSYFNDSSIDHLYICIRFFYLIDIQDGSKVENKTYVGIRNIKDGKIIMNSNITSVEVLNENQLDDWGMMVMNAFINKDTQLEIYGQRENKNSKLYIDDISMGRTCETGGSCSFENDFCGWTNQNYDIRFIRFQPNTRWQRGNFSLQDTTLKSKDGHYALYAVSGGYSQQTLASPLLRSKTNSICFKFNYFAKTVNASQALKVIFVDLSHSKNNNKKYVIVNGTKEIVWKEFKQQFTDVPKYYRLQITLADQQDFLSDIGIDDISVINAKCDYTPSIPTAPSPSEMKLNCDFETSNCNWKASPGWTIAAYSGQSDNYAPRIDHTSGTLTGKYAMVHPQPGTFTYTLQSALNVSYDLDRCFSFWYYEDGEEPFKLNVYQTNDQFMGYLNRYTSQLESRKKWTLIKTDVPVPTYKSSDQKEYGLMISYEMGSKNKDFLKFAIDDIKVTPGLCSHQTGYVYTFENGYDDLELENLIPLNSYAAITYKPAYTHKDNYPVVDHTTNTDDGTYFLFRPDNYYTRGTFFASTLAIINLKGDTTGTKCVRFAYQITPNVTLKAFALPEYQYDYDYEHQDGLMIWASKHTTQSQTWTMVEFNKVQYNNHKLVLYMSSIPSSTDFLAIDDLVILNQKCQPPIDCDFEQSRFCSYSPLAVKEDNFNFGIFTAPADDSNWPGPKYDHTTGSYGGAYMYLTSYRTSNTSSAHTAKIISGPRDVVRGNSYCLSLYTQLNTADLSLKLSLIRLGPNYSSSNQIISIGSISNVKQTSWTSMYIQLNDSNIGTATQIQLIIEGSLGAQSTGAIAVDDIIVLPGQCPSSNNGGGGMTCENGKVLNQSQICDFVNDCPSGLDEAACGTCDFEKDTCGWTNISSFVNGFSWVKASDIHTGNAPTEDGDSKKDGHYLLLFPESDFKKINGEVAVNFDQPPLYFKHAYRTCVMVFDYYIKTSLGSNPRLEIKVGSNRADSSVVYRIMNSQTKNAWRKGYAHISNRFRPFFVDISAQAGPYGAIGVDNVKFTNCSFPAPTSSCDTTTEFRCSSNQFCISKDSVCDYVNDCGDNADELNCNSWPLRCNFEYTYRACKITEESADSIKTHWQLVSPRSSFVSFLSGYEPVTDNTLGTGYGHYFLLWPSRTADIMTGTFSTGMMTSKSDQTCKLRFFYFIADFPDNVTSTKLRIQIRYASNAQPESNIIQTLSIDSYGEIQQRWNKAVIPLSYTSPFQVIITGTLGTKTSRIAIDDLTFDQNCVSSATPPASVSTLPPATDSPNPNSDGTVSPKDQVTTEAGIPGNPSGHTNPGHGGAITAGILVPLFIVLAAVGGFFWFKKRQQITRSDDTFAFSVNNVREGDM